jgi:peptidoglycan/xylan/chitin deacetylase (PgdA/CDA1 family)
MTGFWPGGRHAAISLTFDDGMDSHLTTAAPELEARDLRGTFYVPAAGSEDDPSEPCTWRERLERFVPAAAAGHEVGNHTVRHPCSLNIDTEAEWGRSGINLLDWTLEDIASDLAEAQRRIEAVFPDQSGTTFAYPCYESTVGKGRDRVSFIPLVADMFVAGRARGGVFGGFGNDPRACDLHYLSSFGAERMPGPLMIGLVERTLACGRWSIFTFHGVAEGDLAVGLEDFRELLDHLVARREEVWTAPVAEVARHEKATLAGQAEKA